MPKSRRLTDLYVVGKEFTVNDESGGEPITVWLQKLSPIDHETALRKSNARRARYIAISRLDEKNDERDSVLNEVFDQGPDKESLVNYLALDRTAKVYQAREAELAAEEEWAENDYLQGLKDSWNDDMYNRFVSDPDDQEALKVKSELERFSQQLDKVIEKERSSAVKDFESKSEKELIKIALDKFVDSNADVEWLNEYRRCEIWLGVRDPETKEKYFTSREEVDSLEVPIFNQLTQAYSNLNVDVTEGKD